jgi:hypothetical protein
MPSDLLKWSSRAKAAADILKPAAKAATEAQPIINVVRAGYGLYNIGNAINKALETTGTLNKAIPQMQVMVGSMCDKMVIMGAFAGAAAAVGIAANMIQTYQGVQALQRIEQRLGAIENTLEAQTALLAHKEFAEYVWLELNDRLLATADDPTAKHLFFVYHPDTMWYASFNHRLRSHPLSTRFCGYTECLDTAVLFMQAARDAFDKHEVKATRKRGSSSSSSHPPRPVVLHLMIPAYRPLLLDEFVIFPETLGRFVVEGAIHNSKKLVWMQIPKEQSHHLSRIENWAPPTPSLLQKMGGMVGLVTLPPGTPRVLGTMEGPRTTPIVDVTPLLEEDEKAKALAGSNVLGRITGGASPGASMQGIDIRAPGKELIKASAKRG